MIDFSFTEEQEKFREKIKDFALEEVEPRRKEWDKQ